MRTFAALLAIAVGLLAAPIAKADIITYITTFGPEVVGATGSGSATIRFDTVTHELQYVGTFSGLSGTTNAAHFHCCTAVPGTGTVSIAVDSPNLVGFPQGIFSGSFDDMLDLDDPLNFTPAFLNSNGGTAAGAIAAFLAGADQGRNYLNIHTSTFPGGEIRGFLQRVPEPASFALLGLGLLGLGLSRKLMR